MKNWKRLVNINLIKQGNLPVYIIYLLIIWLSYYLKFSRFGFYEDDYWIAGIPASTSFIDLLDFIKNNLFSLERNQGRYIATFLPFIISFINFKIGGVTAIYLFGLLLVAFNAYLIYKIIGKNFSFEMAFLTGLIFALYPGDTTKAFIVHIYHLQISLAFTLSGMLLYLNHRRFLGYLLAFTSLMNYENAFLPFILAPFLAELKWDKTLFIKWVKHLTIIGSFFILLFLIRKIVGENTISQLEVGDFIRKTLISYAVGPLVAAYTFLLAAYEAIVNIKETYYVVLFALLLLVIVNFLYPVLFNRPNATTLTTFKWSWSKSASEGHLLILKAMALGIIMTIIGYSFAFPHFPPTSLKGRMTSEHFGAAFGISLFIAGLIRFLISLGVKLWWHRLLTGWIILILSLLSGHGILIQNDFIKSWEIQKKFWVGVIKECPDISENTLVLVKKSNVPETEYVVTYSWAYPLIYEFLYDFPDDWKRVPKLDIFDSDFSEVISFRDGRLIYTPSYPFMYDNQSEVEIEKNNLILLQIEGQKLTRMSDTLFLDGGIEIPLKVGDRSYQYPKKELYEFILGK